MEESEAVRSRTLRPTEWLLLALRMLLIGLLAVLLAAPRIPSEPQRQKMTYVVEAGILRDGLLSGLLDSLEADPEIRLLQEGLPIWDREGGVPETDDRTNAVRDAHLAGGDSIGIPHYWQLAPEINALPSDSILVFTRAFVKGLRSERPYLENRVRWLVAEQEGGRSTPFWAFGDPENAWLLQLESDRTHTAVQRSRLSPSQDPTYTLNAAADTLILQQGGDQKVDAFKVRLFAEEDLESDRRYMEAALRAAARFLDVPLELRTIASKESQAGDFADGTKEDTSAYLTIWLRSGPVPERNGRILSLREDPFASDLIAEGPEEGHYYLTQRLNANTGVDGRLTESLLKLILPMKEAQNALLKADLRQAEASFLFPSTAYFGKDSDKDASAPEEGMDQTEPAEQAAKDLSPYIWLVIV